jgi:uncharacterized small protein (DUF1192 family)
MKIKKMLKALKEATENQSHLYSVQELEYMNHQLKIIEEEILRLEHKNYRGFGKLK